MDAPPVCWTLTEDIDERALPFFFVSPSTVVRYAMVCKRLRTRVPLAGVLLALYKRRMRSPITGTPYPVANFVLDFCMARETLSHYTRVRQAWVIMFRIFFRTLRLFDPHFPANPCSQEIAMWPPHPAVFVFDNGRMPPAGAYTKAERYIGELLELNPGEVLSGVYKTSVLIEHGVKRCQLPVTVVFDRTKNEYELHPIDPTTLWESGGFGGHRPLGPKLPSADVLWTVVETGLEWDKETEDFKAHFRKLYAEQEDRDAAWPLLCEYTFS